VAFLFVSRLTCRTPGLLCADKLADLCFAHEVAGKKANRGDIDHLSGQMRPAMETVKVFVESL
jgi:hypothetical protein